MILRPYQAECLDKIQYAYRRGVKRALVSMATGGGKTTCFSKLPNIIPLNGKKMAIFAHREELLDQAATHVQNANPTLKVGVEQGTRRADKDVDVLISSVQTLQKKRLAEWPPGEIGTIVIDECIRGDARILMADNTTKPMSDVHVGDRVICYTGKREQWWDIRKVTWKKEVERDSSVVVHKRIQNRGEPEEPLHCTPEHLVLTGHGYGKAENLKAGWVCTAYPFWYSEVNGGNNYTCYEIADVEKIHGTDTFYDIEVEEYHNFVANGIVTHNCHHARVNGKSGNNSTYQAICDHFKVWDKDGPFVLGVTATPNRADGAGLGTLFQEVVFHYGITDLIDDGWLVPVKCWSIDSEVDISNVKRSMGDFVISQLSEAVNQINRNDLIVKSYKEFLKDRQTIVFCVDVAHSKAVCEKFNWYGIEARHIDGTTKDDERSATFEDFKAKKFQVACNVGIYTEGADFPMCSGIIMARPTQSEVLFSQAIGRATRLYPDASQPLHKQVITPETKQDMIVIDICDNAGKHSLVSTPELFGLPPKAKMQGESATELAEQFSMALKVDKNEQGRHVPQEQVRKMAKMINLMAGAENKVRSKSKFNWLEPSKGLYVLKLNDRLMLEATQDLLGTWRTVLCNQKQRLPLYEDTDMTSMIREADAWVEKEFDFKIGDNNASHLKILRKSEAWRKQPATEKQLRYLDWKKIPYEEGITKGDACNLRSLYG